MAGATIRWGVIIGEKNQHLRATEISSTWIRLFSNGEWVKIIWWQYSIKNCMGPYQRTPKEVARAIGYAGLGVRSVGPVGDFFGNILQHRKSTNLKPSPKSSSYPIYFSNLGMKNSVRSAYSKITTPHFQGLSPTTSKKNDAEDLGQLFLSNINSLRSKYKG